LGEKVCAAVRAEARMSARDMLAWALRRVTDAWSIGNVLIDLPQVCRTPRKTAKLLRLVKLHLRDDKDCADLIPKLVPVWSLDLYRVAVKVLELRGRSFENSAVVEMVKAAIKRGDWTMYKEVCGDFVKEPFPCAELVLEAARHSTLAIYRDAQQRFGGTAEPRHVLYGAVDGERVGVFRQVAKDYRGRLTRGAVDMARNYASKCSTGNPRRMRMRQAVEAWAPEEYQRIKQAA
jgi:hypothetical protein